MPYFVYIVQCADHTYYTGCTNNLEKRMHAHNHLKSGARYTKTRRPVKLKYWEEYATESDAKKREYAIKQLDREQKRHLILSFL